MAAGVTMPEQDKENFTPTALTRMDKAFLCLIFEANAGFII